MLKKPRGNILKIREFDLEKINLVDEFDILQIVGEGWFGKILLVEHRATQTEMVLKAVPKPYVSLRDFYREFHYGLHLGIHRNIVTCYDVAFETAGFYVFTQEYAPLGDLTSNIAETGVGEVYSKRVAKQIASAIDYMHSKDIVHRDVKLDNVLIYRSDFTRVKLCDFGESYQTGTIVERRNEWLPYSPPEVLEVRPEGNYKADASHDVWQFGIVIFVCLTGCLPWQKAASDDPRYVRYITWHTSMISIRRTPKLFKLLSSRAQRMFRRFLEPRQDRRPKNLTDLAKFLDDRWLAKSAEKEMAEYETDELCPSMYSFHSSPDEKGRLLYTLADCGIETNVDRQLKKNRIKDWIESSVITEEDEEENEDANSTSPSSSISREPVAGHISSIRAKIEKPKEIKTTLKDANQKHFDPRTGALQQGPSEMGTTLARDSASPSMSTMNNGDSMAGSLLTLGSHNELMIGSSLEMFTSDMEIHRLGTNEYSDYQQQLSNSNLLLTNASTTAVYNAPTDDTTAERAVNQRALAYAQRANSNSTNVSISASSPALDKITYSNVANNPIASSNAAKSASAYFENARDMRSVAFAGITNAFHTLAQMPLLSSSNTVANTSQFQKPQQNFVNNSYNQLNTSVKDSAYGSAEVHNIPSQQNGNQEQQKPSRQLQPYRGAPSMKDTAYDRVRAQNSKKRR